MNRFLKSSFIAAAAAALAVSATSFPADATSGTLPGFAAAYKTPSQANWTNAYQWLWHTTSGMDTVAYNLPIDTSKGYASATVLGTANAYTMCGTLLALSSDANSVWASPYSCNTNSGYSSFAAGVYVPVNGFVSVEVTVSGTARINGVAFGL